MKDLPIDIWNPVSENFKKKLMSDFFMTKQTSKVMDSIDIAIQQAGFKIDNKRIKTLFIKWVKNLPEYEFSSIINEYRQQKMNNEFLGDWNPFYIKTKNDLIKEIKRLSFRFRGDPITLSILKDILKIDFVVIINGKIQQYINPNNERLIILNYNLERNEENEMIIKERYEIIGLNLPRYKKTKCIFKKESLPIEIQRMLSLDDTFLYHIKNICGETTCEVKSLHTILSQIEDQMGGSIESNNRKRVIQLLYTWIKNNDYLKSVKNK